MSNKKIIAIIFLLAFLMRMAALFSFAEEKSLLYVSDSLTYIQVAKNIINHGVYSMEISDTPHPDNFRTPLYPIFLIPFVWLKTSLYVPAIVQCLIMSLGAALIFLLGQKIFSRKTAAIAAVLFAIEPFGALISAQIMTEAMFVSLFVPSLLLLGLYIKNHDKKKLALAAILLALASLARPVAFYLFILIPISAFIIQKKIICLKDIFIPLILFFTIVGPWITFNIFAVKTFEFSSLPGFDLYAYHGTYFNKWRIKRGADSNDTLPKVDLGKLNDTLNARAIPELKSVGLSYILSHKYEYAFYQIIRMPRLYTDSGYASILNGIPQLQMNYGSIKGGFFDRAKLTDIENTLYKPIKNSPILLVLLLADIGFIIISILAFSNPIIHRLKSGEWNKVSLFFVLFLILYTFLASPIGGARFRIPINPLLFLLSIDSVLLLTKNKESDTVS